MTKKNDFDATLENAMTISKKRGQELIRKGLETLSLEHETKVLAFVAGNIKQLQVMQDERDNLDRNIQFLKDRLQAIHDGKFSVNQRGDISFSNAQLNG